MDLFDGFTFRWCIFSIVVTLFSLTESFSVVMEPSTGFEAYTDVFFTGTVVSLHCNVYEIDIDDANVSIYLNDSKIFENGVHFTKPGLVSRNGTDDAYRLQVNNVTLDDGGRYTCKVESQESKEEDSFLLNVVSDSPQCITHCNTGKCQLLCYSRSLSVEENFKWEKSHNWSTPFEIVPSFSSLPSANKGVSNLTYKYEDVFKIYKCSVEKNSPRPERSCTFNFSKPTTHSPAPSTTEDDFTTELPTSQQITTVAALDSGQTTFSKTVNMMDQSESGWLLIGVLCLISVLVLLSFIAICSFATKSFRKINNDDVTNSSESKVYRAGYMTSTSFAHVTLDKVKYGGVLPVVTPTKDESANYTRCIIDPGKRATDGALESKGKALKTLSVGDGYYEPHDLIHRPYVFTRPYSAKESCDSYSSSIFNDIMDECVNCAASSGDKVGTDKLKGTNVMVDNIVYEPYDDSQLTK